MYFRNKFNKEVQNMIRSIDKIGCSTTIGDNTSELFVFQGVQHTSDMKPDFVKIFPMVMYDTLSSSNLEDTVYNESDLSKNKYCGCIIARNTPGTIISCGRKEDES